MRCDGAPLLPQGDTALREGRAGLVGGGGIVARRALDCGAPRDGSGRKRRSSRGQTHSDTDR